MNLAGWRQLMRKTSPLEADHYSNNPLQRIADLEERVASLERLVVLNIAGSGNTGVTEQAYVSVIVEGEEGYIRVFATR